YIQDGNNCVAFLDTTIASFPAIDISAITSKVVHLTCSGVNTGEIRLSHIIGGIRPLTFSLNGGTPQSDSTFKFLAAGNYDVDITDAKGCTFTFSTVVNSPNPIFFTLTPIKLETCNNADGEVRLSGITGG